MEISHRYMDLVRLMYLCQNNRMKVVAFFLALLFSLSACYERREGCLDLQATNFDLSADRPCADCCQYPSLFLSPQHRIIPADQPDTSFVFSYDSAYAVAPHEQDSFRFQSLFFYLYDFELKGPQANLEVSDELSWYDAQGERRQSKDDFVLVEAGSSSNLLIGTLREYGSFDSLIFWVGLPPEIQTADISRMPEGHPLQFRSDSLNWEEGLGYIPLRLAMYRDADQLSDSIVLRIFEPVRVSLSANNTPFELMPGSDAVLKLQFNYLAWLQGADVRHDQIEALETRLHNQLPDAFSW